MDTHYRGRNIVFVVGCPRSGTTWVQKLLAAHAQIKTGQESDLFALYVGPQLRAWRNNLDQSENSRGGLGLACYHREMEFMDILRTYLDALLAPMVAGLNDGELFVEKSPAHALFLNEIMELLPESRIIHVLRDPRDVVASLMAASKSWGKSWAPGNAAHATMTWLSHVRSARTAAQTAPCGHFLETTYELLYSSPHEELKKMMDFLGLSWSEANLAQAIEANSAENILRTGGTPIQVRGEFGGSGGRVASEPSGFLRKARPGAWRNDLSWRDRWRIWRMARLQMGEVGYGWTTPFA